MNEKNRDDIKQKIVEIGRSNFIIGITFKGEFMGSNAHAGNFLTDSNAEFILEFIKKDKRTYYYFDRKYREQFSLHPVLTKDILIAKYPDNTFNNLIKEYT